MLKKKGIFKRKTFLTQKKASYGALNMISCNGSEKKR